MRFHVLPCLQPERECTTQLSSSQACEIQKLREATDLSRKLGLRSRVPQLILVNKDGG